MLIGVVALAALLVFAAAAPAGKKRLRVYTTHATLRFTSPDTFTGKLWASGRPKADRRKCTKGRTVTLLYYDPSGTPPAVLGIDKTNRKARYEFTSRPFAFSGGYRLSVGAVRIKGHGGMLTKCRETKTPIQQV
jgi:hypothetical protein